jgi:carboxypeptidase Taq
MVAQAEAVPEPGLQRREKTMTTAVDRLREWLAEIADLSDVTHLLEWDQQTMMPARGAAGRAEALATLRRVSHERFTSKETGVLLESARAAINGDDPASDEASLIRVSARRWEKARRVPIDLAADRAKAASIGQEAWAEARERSDFEAFVPYLEKNLELTRQYVECFDDFDCPYDVLLDDFEPGMRTAEVDRLFAQLKSELVPLITTLAEHSDRIDGSCLHGHFAAAD